MPIIAEKITHLLNDCKIYENRREKYGKKSSSVGKSSGGKNNDSKDEKKGGRTKRKPGCNIFRSDNEKFLKNDEEVVSREELARDVDNRVSGSKIRTASVEFASLSKMSALSCFAEGNEIEAIGHLIESHAVILQQHIFHRYIKSQVRERYLNSTQESGLKPIHMRFDEKSANGVDSFRSKLIEMPPEWYMIQVTVSYEKPHSLEVDKSVLDCVRPLHITVLPTGKDAIEPICITVPGHRRDRDYREYDGLKEIVAIQKTNKAELEAYYKDNRAYWRMREKQNHRMKSAVKELEYTWLREWRILFMADPLENSPLVNELRSMIDKLIADDLSVIDLSARSKWLLKKIATGCCYLTKAEIARAVHHVLGNDNKLANNVILSIYGKLINVDSLKTEKRKTLVMIVDESIDHVPFETIDVLTNHPVTRFPSFHIAYAMFKEHEDEMVNGCKIIKMREDFATFIVDPACNLAKMEKRMKLFCDYWMPDWKGTYGTEPDEDSFEKVLVNYDLLMYSGHGSGIQYLPGEKIERLRVRSTVLLFGCSSVKLHSSGGRFPPYGVSNQYLIACSPCVLGMLWEVTDGDIDRMTARFMSNWIPAVDDRSWSNVNMDMWCEGVLQFKPDSRTSPSLDPANEPELLRAVATSRSVCTQHMTAAAIVVRGLPIRLE